jgi:hypothetical protein
MQHNSACRVAACLAPKQTLEHSTHTRAATLAAASSPQPADWHCALVRVQACVQPSAQTSAYTEQLGSTPNTTQSIKNWRSHLSLPTGTACSYACRPASSMSPGSSSAAWFNHVHVSGWPSPVAPLFSGSGCTSTHTSTAIFPAASSPQPADWHRVLIRAQPRFQPSMRHVKHTRTATFPAASSPQPADWHCVLIRAQPAA